MASYILRRLLQAIPIVIGISVVSFLIVHLTPGSPVDKFRTPRVSPETINNLIRLYGLDQPLPTQVEHQRRTDPRILAVTANKDRQIIAIRHRGAVAQSQKCDRC